MDGRNGRDPTRDSRLIKGEEDGTEEGGRLFVGIGFETRIDVDNESGADGRKQTSLRDQVR